MPLVNAKLENAFQEWEDGAGLSEENKKILNDNGWDESTNSAGEPVLIHSSTEGKRFLPRSNEEPLHKKSRSRK